MHDAALRVDRVIFIKHPAFKEGAATVVKAGALTMVCAPPSWWDELVYRCIEEGVRVSEPAGKPVRFRGVPVRWLEYYRRDPDWPVILEAIMHFKLFDFSAVFG